MPTGDILTFDGKTPRVPAGLSWRRAAATSEPVPRTGFALRAISRGEGYKNLNVITDFYDLLAAATGNQMLRFLTHGIAQVLSGLIRSKHPARIDDLVERRREILASLRARGADAAKKLLTNHLMYVHARIQEIEPAFDA